MDYISIIGFIAAACTTIAIIPQAVKSWKTKKTKDISLGMYTLATIGVFLWLVYGIAKKDLPLILANTVTFIFVSTVLYLKLKYG